MLEASDNVMISPKNTKIGFQPYPAIYKGMDISSSFGAYIYIILLFLI